MAELKDIPVLRYLKDPANSIDDLYKRYPDGGEYGWYAFVFELQTFVYWNMNTGDWEKIAGSTAELEQLQDQIDEITEQLTTIENNLFQDKYSNTEYTGGTTTTVGGIAQGSVLVDKTMKEMWDMLLHPFQNPAFSAFSISGQSTPIELGTEMSATRTHTFATTNSANIQANSISISHMFQGVPYVTDNLPNTGTATVTDVAIKYAEPSTYVFTIQARNKEGATFSRTHAIEWKYKIFHGTSVSDPIDSAAVRALANSLFNTNSLNITINALKYVIAVPEGKTITMVRTSNFEDITDNFIKQPDVIEVLLPDSVTTKNYDIYVLTTALPLDVTATVTLA